jgi:hypothetical protein
MSNVVGMCDLSAKESDMTRLTVLCNFFVLAFAAIAAAVFVTAASADGLLEQHCDRVVVTS